MRQAVVDMSRTEDVCRGSGSGSEYDVPANDDGDNDGEGMDDEEDEDDVDDEEDMPEEYGGDDEEM